MSKRDTTKQRLKQRRDDVARAIQSQLQLAGEPERDVVWLVDEVAQVVIQNTRILLGDGLLKTPSLKRVKMTEEALTRWRRKQ